MASEPDDISISQWVLLEKMRLDNFIAWWEAGQSGRNDDGIPADAFPDKQPIGEWDEQYRCFGGG